MVKVLVTGASGFIGSVVCKALVREGFHVTGMVRSLDKGKDLLRHEVALLKGDLNNVDEFKDHLAQFSVVIDTVFDITNPKDPSVGNRNLVNAILAARPHLRTFYLYTSGLLCYDHDPDHVYDESMPPNNPVATRANHETWSFQQERLDTVVIRPGFVYGYAGSQSVAFFPKGDTVTIKGNKDRRWSWVHVDDLADAYVRVVRKFDSVKGHVFNIGSEHAWPQEQIYLKVARHVGFQGKIEYAPVTKDDPFWEHYIDITVVVSTRKAREMLGWCPKRLPFWDDLDTYVRAFRANQEGQPAASTSH